MSASKTNTGVISCLGLLFNFDSFKDHKNHSGDDDRLLAHASSQLSGAMSAQNACLPSGQEGGQEHHRAATLQFSGSTPSLRFQHASAFCKCHTVCFCKLAAAAEGDLGLSFPSPSRRWPGREEACMRAPSLHRRGASSLPGTSGRRRPCSWAAAATRSAFILCLQGPWPKVARCHGSGLKGG